MKKYILFYLFLIIASENLMAQVYRMITKYENIPHCILSKIGEMGMDESPVLTELEGKYFNAIVQNAGGKIDLCGKKTAFFTGNIGGIQSNKKKYFMAERERLKTGNDSSSYYFGTLYVLNASQKEESGGYDAVIVGLSKKISTIQEVVKKMRTAMKYHNK